ncbi:MAG: DUF4493 domain-containing protein [Muribaculaceae bacterium]|nr:DUF4493 domain-containing protein [Muribaculaceae bacterium]
MRGKCLGVVSVALMLLVSCGSEDNPSNTGSGSVNFRLNVDSDVIESTDAVEERSVDESVPVADDFKIRMSSEDGSYSHTWGSISEFPTDEQFKIGRYRMEAYYGSLENEGFGMPYYYGQEDFVISEASATDVSVTCSLANAMVSIDYTDAFKGYFVDYSTELHSDGGAYIVYDKDETRPVYLRPGNISMTVSLTLPSGVSTTFQPAVMENALARHHYHVTMDVNGGNMGPAQLVIAFDDALATEDFTIDLSDELMSSPAPEITTEGFVSEGAVQVTEGQIPETQARMVVSARAGIKSVMLTTSSSSLIADGWPAEMDLMAATEQEQSMIARMGLRVEGLWHNPDKMALLDFTGLLGNLRYDESKPLSTFTVVVKDKLTKVSEPVSLVAEVLPVNVTIESKGTATIGDNMTDIVVSCSSQAVVERLSLEACGENGMWEDVVIASVVEEATGSGKYRMAFTVPDGVADVPVRLKYCGAVKAETVIMRTAPKFNIEVDAYANRAVVKILPLQRTQLAFLTRHATVMADGVKKNVISRDEEAGEITVTGLNPSTNYSIKATVMEGNSNPVYCDAVGIYTEAVQGIPNGDFEEIDDLIDYEGLFSGGRYSSSTVAIINQQNRITVDVDFPKDWASVNAKTFCETANNRNTWYMQPSAMIVADKQSGTKAMMVKSVAWDVNGEAISDYVQEGTPYVRYNRNVPNISYRATGKLFLGEYRFDAATMSEVYNEGIGFGSRPSALNGYFKYAPSAADYSDKGLVAVKVIGNADGKEVVIADAKMELSAATDYTAFSLPIKYGMFGVKAVRIQVMASSSKTTGSIPYETSKVKTSPDCASASSTGSVLWIDNLSFSY